MPEKATMPGVGESVPFKQLIWACACGNVLSRFGPMIDGFMSREFACGHTWAGSYASGLKRLPDWTVRDYYAKAIAEVAGQWAEETRREE